MPFPPLFCIFFSSFVHLKHLSTTIAKTQDTNFGRFEVQLCASKNTNFRKLSSEMLQKSAETKFSTHVASIPDMLPAVIFLKTDTVQLCNGCYQRYTSIARIIFFVLKENI